MIAVFLVIQGCQGSCPRAAGEAAAPARQDCGSWSARWGWGLASGAFFNLLRGDGWAIIKGMYG